MDYERSIISKVLNDQRIHEALSENISVEIFDEKYRPMWIWLVDHFRDFGDVPGEQALQKEFPNFTVMETTESVAYYAEELRRKYVHNKMKEAMKQAFLILKKKENPLDGVQILNDFVMDVENVAKKTQDLDWAATGDERLAEYRVVKDSGGVSGIPWMFPSFNRLTMGMQGGDLILIAAKTGVGKTWAEVVGAHHDWTNGYTPLLFTNEMAAKKIARRLDAVHSKLPYGDLRAGLLDTVTEQRWVDDIKVLRESPRLPIIGGAGMTVSTVRAKIEQYQPDSVWIDGMYLMDDEKRARSQWERLINITRGLKIVGSAANIPIVVTLQLNEDDAIALSKGMERDGDVILFLRQSEDQKLANELDWVMTKNREGKIGQWSSYWNFDTMEVDEIITESVDIQLDDGASIDF